MAHSTKYISPRNLFIAAALVSASLPTWTPVLPISSSPSLNYTPQLTPTQQSAIEALRTLRFDFFEGISRRIFL